MALASSRPTVRMNRPIRSFCWPKTCSTADRTRDFVALPRRISSGISRRSGFWRWIWLKRAAIAKPGLVDLRSVGRIRPDDGCPVVGGDDLAQHGAIMTCCTGYGPETDHAEGPVDRHMRLAAEHCDRPSPTIASGVLRSQTALTASRQPPLHLRELNHLRTSTPAVNGGVHLGVRIGITAVLHTCASAMTYQPHVHMIVPGGGIAHGGKRWIASRRAFRLPVRVLDKLFRRLFLARFAVALSHARCRSYKNVEPNPGKSLLVQSAAKFSAYPPFERIRMVGFACLPKAAISCSPTSHNRRAAASLQPLFDIIEIRHQFYMAFWKSDFCPEVSHRAERPATGGY